MTTKYRAIDDIVESKESKVTIVRRPEYNIPNGLPPIDLEIRTPESRELYVVVDVKHDRTRVDACMESLQHAADQIRDTGYQGKVYLFVECLHAQYRDLPPDARRVAYPVSKRSAPAAPVPTR